MAGDALGQIQQARQALKVKQALQQQQLEATALQQKQEVEKLRLQAQLANEQAETQLSGAEQQLRERQRAQQQQARAQGQQQRAAQEQADAPILGEPQSIDGTRPDLATMPNVGPAQLRTAQPGGAEGAGGSAQMTPYGPLTPYIERTIEREHVQQNRFGGVPTQSRVTERTPNVVDANTMAYVAQKDRQAAGTRMDTYYKGLAKSLIYDPENPVVQAELAQITDPKDVLMLRRALALESGSASEADVRNQLEILRGGKMIRVPEREALYETTGALERAAAGATRLNVGPFDLTPATRNEVQSKMVGSLAALEQLSSIESAYKPEFLQKPEQMRQWAISIGKRFGMTQDQQDELAKTNDYNKLMALTATYTAEKLHEVAGAALTPLEFKMNQPRLPLPTDDPDQFIQKVRTLRRLTFASYIRHRKMLADGFDDEAAWLANHPDYIFSGGVGVEPTRGEKTVARDLNTEAEALVPTLRQEPNYKGLSDVEVKAVARQQVLRAYGIYGEGAP